jgi:hypothetical protein
MQAFQVSVNGEKVCLAGIDDDGVLTTIVHHAARQRDSGTFLEVGGMISQTKEHVKWTIEGSIGAMEIFNNYRAIHPLAGPFSIMVDFFVLLPIHGYVHSARP